MIPRVQQSRLDDCAFVFTSNAHLFESVSVGRLLAAIGVRRAPTRREAVTVIGDPFLTMYMKCMLKIRKRACVVCRPFRGLKMYYIRIVMSSARCFRRAEDASYPLLLVRQGCGLVKPVAGVRRANGRRLR